MNKIESNEKMEVRRLYADVKVRGGDAYAAHKVRLQELSR